MLKYPITVNDTLHTTMLTEHPGLQWSREFTPSWTGNSFTFDIRTAAATNQNDREHSDITSCCN